ncbi:MAG: insulinase family protein [Treponemataceae bacterium]|nr:insulinase family protein [Treponemataceae bacterium]
MAVNVNELSNNIVLIAEPIATVKTVAIGFWFSAGSRYEKADERGIAHFTEHMIFKGTKNRSAYDIASAFDRIGGNINAFTEREQICLQCVVPCNYAEYALSILCDMTENGLFDEDDVDRERLVIENEIISSLDDPEEAAMDAVMEAVLPDNPVSWNICGSVESVRTIDSAKLKAWYSKFISGGELAVCIAGNFDVDKIAGLLQRCSVKKKNTQSGCRNESRSLAFGGSPVWKPGFHYVKADFQQEQIMVLFPLKETPDESSYYSMAVLNALTGDTMSSRLFQCLRENKGYCYNVYSFFTVCTDCGFWCAYASVPKKKLPSVCMEISLQLRCILTDGVSLSEIEAAREHLCGEEIIFSEDIENRMKRLFRNFSYGFSQSDWEQTVDKLRLVDEKALAAAAASLFDAEGLSFVIYGPSLTEKQRQKLEESLRIWKE